MSFYISGVTVDIWEHDIRRFQHIPVNDKSTRYLALTNYNQLPKSVRHCPVRHCPVRQCPILQCPPLRSRPSLSSPAMSSPVFYSSVNVQSYNFSQPRFFTNTFRPHLMHRLSIDAAAYCYTRCYVVHLSVYPWQLTVVYPAKTAEPIEMPFSMWARVGPSNNVLDGGPDLFRWRGNFGGGDSWAWSRSI